MKNRTNLAISALICSVLYDFSHKNPTFMDKTKFLYEKSNKTRKCGARNSYPCKITKLHSHTDTQTHSHTAIRLHGHAIPQSHDYTVARFRDNSRLRDSATLHLRESTITRFHSCAIPQSHDHTITLLRVLMIRSRPNGFARTRPSPCQPGRARTTCHSTRWALQMDPVGTALDTAIGNAINSALSPSCSVANSNETSIAIGPDIHHRD